MHSETCGYKDTDALLYALFDITDDKRILISAQEISVFDDYLKAAKANDKDISIDCETCDNVEYQLVYGALCFYDIDKEKLMEYINGIKNCALINLDGDKFGDIKASAYADIQLFEDKAKHKESIPFVAVMQTLCKEQEFVSTSMFPYCYQTVWESMVNRPFLLACRKFVSVNGLTVDNWKEHVDMSVLDEAYRLYDLYTGPIDE